MAALSNFIVLAIGIFVASSSAWGQDREWIPYNELLKLTMLDKFYDAPPNLRDRIKLHGTLSLETRAINLAEVVLTLGSGEGKERIRVSADGAFDVPVNARLRKENPMVYTNVPKGTKGAIGISAYAILPEGLNLPYATLMAGVQQGNDLIKAQAGILRLFAPKFDGVEIHFARPAQQSLQIVAKSGTRTFVADAKGAVALKFDASLFKENPQVLWSEQPLDVEISAE